LSAVAPAVIGEARASEALAIVAGSGTLPFAVADAALGAGRAVVLFAIRNAAIRRALSPIAITGSASGSSVSCAGSRAPRDAARWC
jgi:hypothetical protein